MRVLCLDPAGKAPGIATGGGEVENLGLEYIAGTTRDCGHEVRMLQPPLNDVSDEEILEEAIRSDVVAISCMAYNAEDAIKVALNIRRWSAKTRLVVGGPGPSGMPEWFTDAFDAVIVGEGEHEFRLWLQSEGGIFAPITHAGRKMDWDGRPLPMRDPEVMRKSHMCGIWPIMIEKQVLTAMQYGRGCPNNCWFCSSPTIWKRKLCWRPPTNVADEMEDLIETYGVNSIDLMDATFNANPHKVMLLCEELIRRGIGKKVSWFTTMDPAQKQAIPEMFVALAEAGCLKGGFGLEDPLPEARQQLEKRSSDIDACYRTLQAASDAGLMNRLYLIIGAPGQNERNIESMKEMLSTWPIDDIRISIFCPFPGTRAWFDLQDKIVERDLAKYDANWPIVRCYWPPQDLLAIRRDLARSFYNGQNYRQRRAARIARDPRYLVGYEQLEQFLAQAGYIDRPIS